MSFGIALNTAVALTLGVFGGQDRKPDEKPFDDATFVAKAGSGGMLKVALGKLAMSQAKDDAVKKFAETIVTDHGKANEELKKAAKEAGVSVPERMIDEHQKLFDTFKEYKGSNFDQDYMKHMVTSHEKAADHYKRASKEAKNPRLKDFAAKTLPVVQAHLDAARKIEVK